MKTPQFSGSKLPPASEYALIIGAGATAAMSMAAQQIAVATLPVTTLVALGLLNRYRLDQRLQDSEPSGPTPEEATRSGPAVPQRVTAQPRPDTISARPQVSVPPTAAARFSDQRHYIHDTLAKKLQAKADFEAMQQASLRRVGAHLQQIRQEKALSLEEIYQRTFIQPYTLRALETGNLQQLPEPFYIRAFIQKYATALGLEGTTLAADFPM
ncbi:helix-turn-helix domain-containing protein [Nodosilinea sp. PGN35]|uniref:helix-turn-helix domain-containing protein n=1 Tax=Nodosilinea sp. PGN35 TaxID=3020489 RepID=UPI0023B2B468|nr:helix-turn-helix domain-containing protein [Nodosilinea sp. TSF1-S3]MDF0365200.1 helix-turn-helix domain-containing protein [Nodosilinea sp. TSF1-S3]